MTSFGLDGESRPVRRVDLRGKDAAHDARVVTSTPSVIEMWAPGRSITHAESRPIERDTHSGTAPMRCSIFPRDKAGAAQPGAPRMGRIGRLALD
jgi:hypothetical protein